MQTLDLDYICTTVEDLFDIPVRLYNGASLVFSRLAGRLHGDPLTACRNEVQKIRTSVSYYMTPQLFCYGVINCGTSRLIFGPAFQSRLNHQQLRRLAFEANIPTNDTEAFTAEMSRLPVLPFDTFLQILATLDFLINHEKIAPGEIPIYDPAQGLLSSAPSAQKEDSQFGEDEDARNVRIRKEYDAEQALLHMITNGDTAAIKTWFASVPTKKKEEWEAASLSDARTSFILFAAQASASAITGGLDSVEAIALRDSFVDRSGNFGSSKQIVSFQVRMSLEFTERVERIRFGQQPTKLSLAVSNYIQRHLSTPVRADDIAGELFLSRPYLSSKFHEETGKTLTDFILEEKTEEAKRLLRFTSKSSAAIGDYLGFSSQSHFSRVFKKYTGFTPNEYREQHS